MSAANSPSQAELDEHSVRTLRLGSFRMDDTADTYENIDLDKDVYSRDQPAQSFSSASSLGAPSVEPSRFELGVTSIVSAISSLGFMIGSLALYFMHKQSTGLPLAAVAAMQGISIVSSFVVGIWALKCVGWTHMITESVVLGLTASYGLAVAIIALSQLIEHVDMEQPKMLTGLSIAMTVVQLWFIFLTQYFSRGLQQNNLVRHMSVLDIACLAQGVVIGLCSYLQVEDSVHGRPDIIATFIIGVMVFCYAGISVFLAKGDARRDRASSTNSDGLDTFSGSTSLPPSPNTQEFYDFDHNMVGDPYAFHGSALARM